MKSKRQSNGFDITMIKMPLRLHIRFDQLVPYGYTRPKKNVAVKTFSHIRDEETGIKPKRLLTGVHKQA